MKVVDDYSTAEIVVLVIVFLIKGIIAPMSSFWLGFGLGFFVSDGGGREISILHSLGPPLRKRLVNLLLDGLHLRFLLHGDSKL